MNRARMLFLKEQGKLKDPEIAEMLLRKDTGTSTAMGDDFAKTLQALRSQFSTAFGLMHEDFAAVSKRVATLEHDVANLKLVIAHESATVPPATEGDATIHKLLTKTDDKPADKPADKGDMGKKGSKA